MRHIDVARHEAVDCKAVSSVLRRKKLHEKMQASAQAVGAVAEDVVAEVPVSFTDVALGAASEMIAHASGADGGAGVGWVGEATHRSVA